MNRFPIKLALASIILVLTFAASADKKNGLADLTNRLKEIETITGEFVQYSVDQKGSRLQESKGEFKAKRPGLFYWATSEPLEQYIYSDGDRVTVYDPDLEQVTMQKLDPSAQTTPAILFSGDPQQIGELFEVEMQVFDDVVTQYFLTPKTEESLFNNLRVEFEGKQLVEMRLRDSLGQTSTVHFIQTQINEELSEDAFEAEYPAGTDVIRDTPVPPASGALSNE